MLLSHSNLSNVLAFKRPLLCEWLKKVIVHHVIGCLGKQKGRQNLEQYDWWIRVLSKWAATQIDVLHHELVVNATILV